MKSLNIDEWFIAVYHCEKKLLSKFIENSAKELEVTGMESMSWILVLHLWA